MDDTPNDSETDVAAADGSEHADAGDERLPLVVFAQACAIEPDRIRKFVWLGLIDPVEEGDEFVFARRQVVAVERIERLRHGLSISYRAVGVVTDLLDRIDALETELRTLRPPPSGPASGRASGAASGRGDS